MKKDQPKDCKKFYIKNKLLKKLIANAKHEKKFRIGTSKQTLLESILENSKNEFTDNIHNKLGIRVNQVKKAGHGANVENGHTTMKFLDPANREKVLSLYFTKNDKEKEDLNLLLDQALIIIGVTNRIGKIRVQSFANYVEDAYKHWINQFGKFVHIKSSLHWTMGHIAQLIANNEAYTLAEYSENSFENWILHYRYATQNQARQTSMSDNNTDCLRAMYLPTRHEIRQYQKASHTKDEEPNRISEKINSFFIVNEDGKKWSFSGQYS